MNGRLLVPILVILAVATPSSAAPTGRRSEVDQDVARQRFESGREHVRGGRCDVAVDFFRASIEAAPNVGAWLNLGDCLENLGQLQEAYEAYRAGQLLAADKRDDRVALARPSAERIQAKALTLVIGLSPGAQPVEVLVDDVAVPRHRWSAILVSPNDRHTLVARLPGGPPFSREVSGRAGETLPINVLPGAVEERSTREQGGRGPSPSPALRTSAIITASVGAAAWIGAGVFGALAASTRSDLANAIANHPGCSGAYPNESCAPSTRPDLQGVSDRLDAQAATATVLFVGGALLLAGGIAMFLLTPSSQPRAAASAPPKLRW